MSAIVVDVRSPRDFRSRWQQRRPFSVEVGDEYDAVGAGGASAPIRSRSLALPPVRPTAHSVTLVAFNVHTSGKKRPARRRSPLLRLDGRRRRAR